MGVRGSACVNRTAYKNKLGQGEDGWRTLW